MQKHPEKELIKIIARYVDGKIIKGYTFDFFPNKPDFHISPSIFETPKEGNKVLLNELKAVFFVKDFEGNPSYNERKEFTKDRTLHGRKIEVTFKDGEILIGTTTGYDPHRVGFFLFPVDHQSNNLRVFVVSKAIKKIRHLTG